MVPLRSEHRLFRRYTSIVFNKEKGNHEELKIVAEIPGEQNLEKKVRDDLKAFERGRKWFDATDEVLNYIEKVQLVEF